MSASYRNEQRRRWDSLAAAHGSTEPLQAVIGSSALGNAYLDRTTKRLLGKVLRLRKSDVVLDYGCGVGRLSLWLAPHVREVVAMDISPKMVEVATKQSVAAGVGNASFSVAPEGELPLETASVDVLVCGGVLKYVMDEDDLARLVAEFGRVLKPGGRAAVIDEVVEGEPLTVSGEHEIGGTARLRTADSYRERFGRNGMSSHGGWPVYRPRLLRLYSRLGIGHGRKPLPAWLANVLVSAELGLESLLRKRVAAGSGFQLWYFVKDAPR